MKYPIVSKETPMSDAVKRGRRIKGIPRLESVGEFPPVHQSRQPTNGFPHYYDNPAFRGSHVQGASHSIIGSFIGSGNNRNHRDGAHQGGLHATSSQTGVIPPYQPQSDRHEIFIPGEMSREMLSSRGLDALGYRHEQTYQYPDLVESHAKIQRQGFINGDENTNGLFNQGNNERQGFRHLPQYQNTQEYWNTQSVWNSSCLPLQRQESESFCLTDQSRRSSRRIVPRESQPSMQSARTLDKTYKIESAMESGSSSNSSHASSRRYQEQNPAPSTTTTTVPLLPPQCFPEPGKPLDQVGKRGGCEIDSASSQEMSSSSSERESSGSSLERPSSSLGETTSSSSQEDPSSSNQEQSSIDSDKGRLIPLPRRNPSSTNLKITGLLQNKTGQTINPDKELSIFLQRRTQKKKLRNSDTTSLTSVEKSSRASAESSSQSEDMSYGSELTHVSSELKPSDSEKISDPALEAVAFCKDKIARDEEGDDFQNKKNDTNLKTFREPLSNISFFKQSHGDSSVNEHLTTENLGKTLRRVGRIPSRATAEDYDIHGLTKRPSATDLLPAMRKIRKSQDSTQGRELVQSQSLTNSSSNAIGGLDCKGVLMNSDVNLEIEKDRTSSRSQTSDNKNIHSHRSEYEFVHKMNLRNGVERERVVDDHQLEIDHPGGIVFNDKESTRLKGSSTSENIQTYNIDRTDAELVPSSRRFRESNDDEHETLDSQNRIDRVPTVENRRRKGKWIKTRHGYVQHNQASKDKPPSFENDSAHSMPFETGRESILSKRSSYSSTGEHCNTRAQRLLKRNSIRASSNSLSSLQSTDSGVSDQRIPDQHISGKIISVQGKSESLGSLEHPELPPVPLSLGDGNRAKVQRAIRRSRAEQRVGKDTTTSIILSSDHTEPRASNSRNRLRHISPSNTSSIPSDHLTVNPCRRPVVSESSEDSSNSYTSSSRVSNPLKSRVNLHQIRRVASSSGVGLSSHSSRTGSLLSLESNRSVGPSQNPLKTTKPQWNYPRRPATHSSDSDDPPPDLNSVRHFPSEILSSKECRDPAAISLSNGHDINNARTQSQRFAVPETTAIMKKATYNDSKRNYLTGHSITMRHDQCILAENTRRMVESDKGQVVESGNRIVESYNRLIESEKRLVESEKRLLVESESRLIESETRFKSKNNRVYEEQNPRQCDWRSNSRTERSSSRLVAAGNGVTMKTQFSRNREEELWGLVQDETHLPANPDVSGRRGFVNPVPRMMANSADETNSVGFNNLNRHTVDDLEERVTIAKVHYVINRLREMELKENHIQTLENCLSASRTHLKSQYHVEEADVNGGQGFSGVLHLEGIFVARDWGMRKKSLKHAVYTKAYQVLTTLPLRHILALSDPGPEVEKTVSGDVMEGDESEASSSWDHDTWKEKLTKLCDWLTEKHGGNGGPINLLLTGFRKSRCDLRYVMDLEPILDERGIHLVTTCKFKIEGCLLASGVALGKRQAKAVTCKKALELLLTRDMDAILQTLLTNDGKDTEQETQRMIEERSKSQTPSDLASVLDNLIAKVKNHAMLTPGPAMVSMDTACCHDDQDFARSQYVDAVTTVSKLCIQLKVKLTTVFKRASLTFPQTANETTDTSRPASSKGEGIECSVYVADRLLASRQSSSRRDAHTSAFRAAFDTLVVATGSGILEELPALTPEELSVPEVIDVVYKGHSQTTESNRYRFHRLHKQPEVTRDPRDLVLMEHQDWSSDRFRYAHCILSQSATRSGLLLEWTVGQRLGGSFSCEMRVQGQQVSSCAAASKREAVNLASAMALFSFFETQPVVQVFHPDYPSVWVTRTMILQGLGAKSRVEKETVVIDMEENSSGEHIARSADETNDSPVLKERMAASIERHVSAFFHQSTLREFVSSPDWTSAERSHLRHIAFVRGLRCFTAMTFNGEIVVLSMRLDLSEHVSILKNQPNQSQGRYRLLPDSERPSRSDVAGELAANESVFIKVKDIDNQGNDLELEPTLDLERTSGMDTESSHYLTANTTCNLNSSTGIHEDTSGASVVNSHSEVTSTSELKGLGSLACQQPLLTARNNGATDTDHIVNALESEGGSAVYDTASGVIGRDGASEAHHSDHIVSVRDNKDELILSSQNYIFSNEVPIGEAISTHSKLKTRGFSSSESPQPSTPLDIISSTPSPGKRFPEKSKKNDNPKRSLFASVMSPVLLLSPSKSKLLASCRNSSPCCTRKADTETNSSAERDASPVSIRIEVNSSLEDGDGEDHSKEKEEAKSCAVTAIIDSEQRILHI